MPANMSLASLVIITMLSGQGDLATTQHKRDAEINLDVVSNFLLLLLVKCDMFVLRKCNKKKNSNIIVNINKREFNILSVRFSLF